MKILKVLGIVLLAVCVNAAVLPVDKCSLEDSACLKAAFQKAAPIFMAGMPEIGVEVQDVMDMEDISFDLAGLQFTLKDGKLKGLKTVVFDEVKWDLKKKQIDIDFYLDATVKGHYTAGGRILILPITGDGQMKLKLKHIQIKFHVHYEMEKDAEGKEHVVPKKYTYEFDVKDNANFHLSNLFNGNTELSETMLKFLNENWKQISVEFGKPMVDVAAKSLFRNMVNFLVNQPIDDIANV